MFTTSYHNHSKWSDGGSTAEAMFLAAKAAGLREFGLSDHLAAPPEDGYGAESWSLKLKEIDKYIEECLHWKKKLDDENFTIRIGVEIDFFEETHASVIAHLKDFPFDYMIGAIHFLKPFPIDHSPGPWEGLTEQQIDKTWREYWQKTQRMAKTGDFDFLAHLDLPKKFNYLPSEELAADLEETLLVLQACDMPIELNTAGWSKPCAAPYPGEQTLRRACQLGIPTLINADAHRTTDITQFFPQAKELLRKCGYKKVCTFNKRKRQMVDL